VRLSVCMYPNFSPFFRRPELASVILCMEDLTDDMLFLLWLYVGKKMTPSQADIVSFFYADLKSEIKWHKVDCVNFKHRLNFFYFRPRLIIFQRRHYVRKNDTMSMCHFNIPTKIRKKWKNVEPTLCHFSDLCQFKKKKTGAARHCVIFYLTLCRSLKNDFMSARQCVIFYLTLCRSFKNDFVSDRRCFLFLNLCRFDKLTDVVSFFFRLYVGS
jgi:hypothetical protein